MFPEDAETMADIGNKSGLSYWSAESYFTELNKDSSGGFVLLFNKEIAGFILLHLIPPGEAEVLNFAVKENFRGRGFGKLLFEAAVERALKPRLIKTLWLEVRESNFRAIRFYQKSGLKIVGARRNFYACPTENALLMRLEI